MSVDGRSVTVHHGDISLAATDSGGGPGPTVVLMPGFGGTQRVLAAVASRLPGWRVISMDLRGHGRSTTGPWTFDAAVADLAAVVAHLELDRPYVGGHSLGGMVALRYALAGHPVAGVVNIDGWGPGVGSRFVGADPAEVEAQLDELAAGRLPSRLARALTGLTRQGREGTTRQVFAALDRADVVAWHVAAPCRSLALHGVAPAGRMGARVLGAEMTQLQRAHQQGLRRDLAAAAVAAPSLTVVDVHATHQMIVTHPAEVAAAITAFHATA